MKEGKRIKDYALIIAAGGVAALQAMKFEIFQFPIIEVGEKSFDVRMILIYFFSIATTLAIFSGGSDLLKVLNDTKELVSKARDKEKEKTKN